MTPALGQEVEVGKIGQGLKQFWATENARATRASLMNFAIYSEDPDSLESNNALIGAITRDHACRAILVASNPCERKAKAKAWITAHCQLGRGDRKTVCSEQIAFQLRGPTANLVRNIVFAHLESDLPLVLWWQGALSGAFEERLYSRVHRLIVDSSEWEDPVGEFRILAQAQESGARFVLHDLNWTRGYCFRIAVASAFDHARSEGIDRVTVRIRPDGRVAGRMLAAWLGARLGRTPETFVAIEEDAAAPFPVVSLEFALQDREVRIERSEDKPRFLRMEAPGCTRLLPAGRDGIAELISDQLTRAGENRELGRILPLFRETWVAG